MNGRSTLTPHFTIKYNEKTSSMERSLRRPDLFSNRLYQKMDSEQRQRMQSLDAYSLQRTTRYLRNESIRFSGQYNNKDINRSAAIKLQTPNNVFEINKNIPKVPIQFFEEELNGGAEQRIKGRVIYRNNTSKNSYYLLSNLKFHEPCKKIKSFSENQLEFNSKFESGNLSTVVRVSKSEYCLFMREDTNTHGLRQWFYFLVRCNRPMKIFFKIYKFSKKYSLYRDGMKPYIKSHDSQWIQKGQNVIYSYDDVLKCYYLGFYYTFTNEGQQIEVANMPPYTYSRLLRFLKECEHIPHIKIQSIGQTLGGIQIPSIQFINPIHNKIDKNDQKKCIIILGRTHPGQTCSNFSIEAIIKRLKTSEDLLKIYDFFIVPMVNPDGVIVGNHRTSLIGMDLNRKFGSNLLQKQLFPEVEAIKNLVKKIQSNYKIQFLFDFHGHSAKSNIFAYAQQQIIGSQKYLRSRIIPKLLSEKLQSFLYQYCVFDQIKEKKNTARVYFRKSLINSVTFEQSYGLIGQSEISIKDWIKFGQTFIQILPEYVKISNQQQLKQFLSQQIAKDERMKQQKFQKAKQKGKINEKQLQIQDSKIIPKSIPIPKITQILQEQVQQQSLDSGDEKLEVTENQLDYIHKNMFITKRQIKKRNVLELNDMSIQLQPQQISKQRQESILHEQKMPLVSRIMRMKQKQKGSNRLIDILTSRYLEQKTETRQINKNLRLKLPSLPRNIS